MRFSSRSALRQGQHPSISVSNEKLRKVRIKTTRPSNPTVSSVSGAVIVLITHDMGVIAEAADRVAVMYAGRIAEIGAVRDVIKDARHPYTSGLMGSIPLIGHNVGRLTQIEGAMPRLTEIPQGCAFNPRCPQSFERCHAARPDLMPTGGATQAACWLYEGERAHD